jgi:hypothetical protein
MSLVTMSYATSFTDQLRNLLSSVISVGLKVIIFLVILLVGWWIASWIRKGTARLLRRIRLDEAVERGGLHRVVGHNGGSDLVARLVMFAIMLFVLQLAFDVFGPNPVSTLVANVIAWLPKLFVAVAIVVVVAAVGGWVKEIISRGLDGTGYGGVLGVGAQVLIIGLGVIAALDQVGVASAVTTPVLVVGLATVGGIAVVGLGGGLIRPMQHRWERVLNHAETETALATQRMRAYRSGGGAPDASTASRRDSAFGQPPYTGSTTTAAGTKPPADARDLGHEEEPAEADPRSRRDDRGR